MGRAFSRSGMSDQRIAHDAGSNEMSNPNAISITAAWAIVLILATSVVEAQMTWHVDDDAVHDPGPSNPALSDPNEDGSTLHPFDAIQEAIDAAMDGDDVLVHDGTYIGIGNRDIDFIGKAITVRSENGAASCIVDCEGAGNGFNFVSNETTLSTVDGFTIMNGNGGGPRGGGIHCFNGSATIRNCRIQNNSTSGGGGIRCTHFSDPVISNCIITCNSANQGGGIYTENFSSPSIINCTIASNTTVHIGGGMLIGVLSTATISGCTITGNTALGLGAIAFGGSSPPPITNCILWDNTFPQVIAAFITYTDFEGGRPGEGNIDADPLFVDPDGPDNDPTTCEDNDYRLMPGSPCIDAGDNASIPADIADLDGDGDTTEPTPIDLDGNPRIVNGTVDMGAYEVQVLDCNGNGVPDDQDIANGTSADCNENGIPDECDGFIDTTPPEIACSIAPAPEDDSEDSGDEGDDGNDEDAGQQSGSGSGQSSDHGRAGVTGLNQPTGAAVTLRDSGGEEIGTPGGGRDGDAISDEGYDGPIMILFDASDDCGEVTLSAIIDIGCMQIPVENGTVIDFDCNEGDDSGDCEAEEDDGILEIEAASAVMIVTATDESGNTSTCEIVLCSPPDDGSDDGSDDNEGDAGAASEGRLVPRPKARGPRLEEGGSASR